MPAPAIATTKMIVYTLVGSLLMLVAAIATAIISADGGHITFSIAALQQHPAQAPRGQFGHRAPGRVCALAPRRQAA